MPFIVIMLNPLTVWEHYWSVTQYSQWKSQVNKLVLWWFINIRMCLLIKLFLTTFLFFFWFRRQTLLFTKRYPGVWGVMVSVEPWLWPRSGKPGPDSAGAGSGRGPGFSWCGYSRAGDVCTVTPLVGPWVCPAVTRIPCSQHVCWNNPQGDSQACRGTPSLAGGDGTPLYPRRHLYFCILSTVCLVFIYIHVSVFSSRLAGSLSVKTCLPLISLTYIQ